MADMVGPLRRQAPVTPPAGRAGARAKQPQPRALRVGVYDPRTRERLRWAGQGLAAPHACRRRRPAAPGLRPAPARQGPHGRRGGVGAWGATRDGSSAMVAALTGVEI